MKVGVLTNSAKEARSWLYSGVSPVDRFTAAIDFSEVGVRKPDPEIFAVAAERMGCRATELL